jgi:hypothetical protein
LAASPLAMLEETPIKTPPRRIHSQSSPAAGLHVHAIHKMSRPLSLFSVQAILVLAIDDGSRILTKYYSNPHPPAGVHTDFPGQIAYKTVKDQKAFEKGLLGGFRADNATWAVV